MNANWSGIWLSECVLLLVSRLAVSGPTAPVSNTTCHAQTPEDVPCLTMPDLTVNSANQSDNNEWDRVPI